MTHGRIKAEEQKRKNKALGIGSVPNFPALELLHDPQTFGERLYENLNRYGELLVGVTSG